MRRRVSLASAPRSPWVVLALLLPVLCLAACSSRPSISFSQLPPSSSGGASTSGVIKGRVKGKVRGRHIVLYALGGGRWWVQPFSTSPFTAIAADGTWTAKIHLGAEYAALLTTDGVQPASVMDRIPSMGNGVEAIQTGRGVNAGPVEPIVAQSGPTIRFSGYDWQVRNIPGDYGAKTNAYEPGNVSLDEHGSLHLRVTHAGNAWVCAEVTTVRSLGYGTYRFGMRDVGQLEPAAMFSLFTRAENFTDQESREMDTHISRWGDALNKSAEFVVQPYFVAANVYRFEIPSGFITTQTDWSPDLARFSVWSGRSTNGVPATAWKFTSGVPVADGSHLSINLCEYGFAKIKPQHETEVVVDTFEFFP